MDKKMTSVEIALHVLISYSEKSEEESKEYALAQVANIIMTAYNRNNSDLNHLPEFPIKIVPTSIRLPNKVEHGKILLLLDSTRLTESID